MGERHTSERGRGGCLRGLSLLGSSDGRRRGAKLTEVAERRQQSGGMIILGRTASASHVAPQSVPLPPAMGAPPPPSRSRSSRVTATCDRNSQGQSFSLGPALVASKPVVP